MIQKKKGEKKKASLKLNNSINPYLHIIYTIRIQAVRGEGAEDCFHTQIQQVSVKFRKRRRRQVSLDHGGGGALAKCFT